MFYSTMWASCGGGFGGRPLGQEVMWRAYLNGFLSVDLENMPEDADMDHVGMRSPISPSHPPLPPLPPSSCTDIIPTGSKITSNLTNQESPDSKSDDDEDDQNHQKMTNGSEYGGDHSSSTPPPTLSPRHHHHHALSHPQVNGISKKRLCGGEDEKIKEYLMRSDTAVIYPEPVGGVSKASESESMQTNIHPEQPSVTEKPKVRGEYLLLKCPHCDQAFSGPQAIHELKDHLSSVHKELPLSSSPVPRASAEPNLVCNKCNATFTCKENLAKHKLFHVSNGQSSMLNADDSATLRKFKCPECGKAFKFKHHLKEHIRIHSGEKPFACANCGKRFSHSGSYSSHMTSKKCLVVNLKVRKVDTRSARGRGSSQNNSFRPIIPKYGSNSGTSSSNGNSGAGANELPLIPAGYMPSSERFPHFMAPGRPQQPYLPLSFHPLLTNAPHYLPLGAFPDVSQLLQNRLEKECSISSDHSSHPQPIPQLPPTSSADKSEENMDISQAKPGELNAVKKILEIVDATVSKQQQGQQTPQSSPKVRNGLLSELLSAAPQASMKIPTGGDVESRDSRCRFCCRLFDSKIDLHQHERYLCPHNIELCGSKPFLIDHQQEQDHSDGESSKDSGEESQTRSSTSILNDDSLQTLRAHYQINPRPKKSEVIRLSRDLKCSTRAVQAWFHSQQHLSRDLQMNGEAPGSPSPALHQTTPFTNIISQYNGALPTSSASIVSQHHGMQDHLPIIDTPKGIPHLRYGQQNLDNDQPLDLSVKVKREDSSSCHSSPIPAETEVLNLSQRSSRTVTPPKENSSYHLSQHHQIHQQPMYFESDKGSPPLHLPSSHLQTSLLYKYMQIGLSGTSLSPQSGNSPMHPPLAAVTPTSPGRSPPHAEAPQGLPSPDAASRADNSSSPSGTIGSYGPLDEHGDADPSSPTGGKKMRLWNQGEGDESTLDDSPGHEEDSSGGSGKMRKSWKLHKVESEEGMYACDQCDKMFSKQSSLARHKYEHSGQRPHKCDVCNKAFKHKHHLTEHKRLHSGEKPFQCNKCLKRFSHSGSYSQHMNHRYSYCKPYHE